MKKIIDFPTSRYDAIMGAAIRCGITTVEVHKGVVSTFVEIDAAAEGIAMWIEIMVARRWPFTFTYILNT
jgi:hypothetical protein